MQINSQPEVPVYPREDINSSKYLILNNFILISEFSLFVYLCYLSSPLFVWRISWKAFSTRGQLNKHLHPIILATEAGTMPAEAGRVGARESGRGRGQGR